MSATAFLAAMKKVTDGALSLPELVDAASALESGLALQLYKVWIAFNGAHPQRYIADFNLSALLGQTGDAEGACAALKAALAQNPDFVPAAINLGGLLERQGAKDAALAQWTGAIARLAAVNGQNIGYKLAALKQVSRLLLDHHDHAGAETALTQSLDLDPHQRDIVEQLVAIRLSQCKWPVVAPTQALDRRAILRGMHPLSTAAYTDDPMLQLAAAHGFVRRAIESPPSENLCDRRAAPVAPGGRPLRVGYVSSDLREHAVGYLMAEFFELHGRSGAVEVYVYYCGPAANDPLHARIRAAVPNWRDVTGRSDVDAARAIAADEIDILIDVNGHTRDARTAVFGLRPAPIQVNWLGYPGTMGTPWHHYIIADEWIVPAGSELYFSEKVVRLPCYQANDRKRLVASAGPTRAEAGLPDGAFVFCCFNGSQKITRFTFDRWMTILSRVPGSVLWLLDGFAPTNARLREWAEARGVARERLVFAPRVANPVHLARYGLADLFLDTAPYGAHTTASDSLWAGVPVLTLSGRSFAARVCGSLVRAAGLPELVVETPDDYVDRAVALGRSPQEAREYRDRLAAARTDCTLFDTDRLVRHLERLYAEMAAEYRAGRRPEPDLANLEDYLEAGIAHPHEDEEMLTVADYRGRYVRRLAERHRSRPLPADGRFWTGADIAASSPPAWMESAAEAAE